MAMHADDDTLIALVAGGGPARTTVAGRYEIPGLMT
jgi:hypothetical protein